MKGFIGVLTIAAIFTLAQSKTCKSTWSYDRPDLWPGICTYDDVYRQSPIDINTRNLYCAKVPDLRFNKDYFQPMSGTWENKDGHTVEFTPNPNVNAIMYTPKGQYKLLQFHMHWDESEHLIDGRASDLEIHFVHKKVGLNEKNANPLAVLSTRGRSAWPKSRSIYNPKIYKQLDVSKIRSCYSDPVDVSGILLRSFMPNNRYYYYYEGSLTTPPCSETVQWFIFKYEIDVPEDYLADLKMVTDKYGARINYNFRYTQPLHGRPVYKLC